MDNVDPNDPDVTNAIAGIVANEYLKRKVHSGGKKKKDGDGPSFKSVASTAAVGATTGLVAGVTVLGAPVTLAAAGTAGGVYLATRNDGVGETARGVGEKGRVLFNKAMAYDKKHDVSGKVKRTAVRGYKKAVDLNEKYDITGKTKSAIAATASAAQSAYRYAREANDKYDVTGKASVAVKDLSRAAKSGARRASAINTKYQISDRAKRVASGAWSALQGTLKSNDGGS